MSSPAYELARCPVCDGAETTLVAGPDEVREELEALWEFHTERLAPETPPERLLDRVAFSQSPPLRLVRCDGCGLVYRNPRERAFELTDLYAGESPDDETLDGLFETQRASYRAQAERLTSELGRAGTGLEVGSYVGAFLAAARDSGWQFEGLDVNEHAAAFARRKGFAVTVGDLTTAATTRRFDAVAIWNCFDQLADPRAAAYAARRLLAPGGLVAIRVPNGGFYAAVRERLGGRGGRVARALLAHNNLLAFPYRHGFTPSSLGRLLEKVGLEVRRVHGDTLVPIADEWTRGWAVAEERAVKALVKAATRSSPEDAPWFEIYAAVA